MQYCGTEFEKAVTAEVDRRERAKLLAHLFEGYIEAFRDGRVIDGQITTDTSHADRLFVAIKMEIARASSDAG